MAHHARMHACTHTQTRTPLRTHQPTAVGVQVVAIRWVGVRPAMTKLMPPFRLFSWQ